MVLKEGHVVPGKDIKVAFQTQPTSPARTSLQCLLGDVDVT